VGGAIYAKNYNKIIISNCTITNNSTRYANIGAIFCDNSCPKIIGNLIINNSRTAINCESASPLIINNTISANGWYGVYLNYSSTPIIANCIIAQNHLDNLKYSSPGPIISYSNIVGANILANGNKDTDPKFAASSSNPFSLMQDSPCLNAGNPNWTLDSLHINKDILGEARIYNLGTEALIDMGAYELQEDPLPYLHIEDIKNKFIKHNTFFTYKIEVSSFPRSHNYDLIKIPDGLFIENDSIKWTPAEAQRGKNHDIIVKVDNGILTDTIKFTIRVITDNEYIDLPDEDVTWNADTVKVFNNLTINDGNRRLKNEKQSAVKQATGERRMEDSLHSAVGSKN
jgi:parallel beta-helix repeat protein